LESNEQLRRTARSARIVGVGGAGAERWRRHADIDSRCSIGAPDGWERLYGRSCEPRPDPH
jgi:hypothetical protein